MILCHFEPEGRPVGQQTNSDEVRHFPYLAEMEFAADFLCAENVAREEQR